MATEPLRDLSHDPFLDDLVEDAAWALWDALTAHPQYRTLPPRTFLGLRRMLQQILTHQMARGGTRSLDVAAVIEAVADRMGLLLADAQGIAMPCGPLAALVEEALEPSLGPVANRRRRAS